MNNTNKFTIALSIIAISATMNIHTIIAQAMPNFELFNKANTSIVVKFQTKGRRMQFSANPGEQRRLMLDPMFNDGYVLTITQPDHSDQSFNIIRSNENNKSQTTYLTWNPTENIPLYPATGPMMGILGKYNPLRMGVTKSGLPLNNNISASQIQRVR